MATLKVLTCSVCTRPLKEGQTKCSCGAENKIAQSDVNPFKLTNEMAQQYIDVFKQRADENPKDTNAMFAMGLFYMSLGNYELAQRNFKMAVDLLPTDPDVYYYYALSLFECKSPNALDHKRAEKIEEWLHTATNIQKKRKHLILLMILRQGAYITNGLQVRGEQPAELLSQIQTMMPEPDELSEIEAHVRISDPQNIEFLKILRGESQISTQRSSDVKYLESFRVTLPSERDNAPSPANWTDNLRLLNDPKERLSFFNHLYEPEKPQRQHKPFYPIVNTIARLAVAAVCTVIFMVIELAVGYSTCMVKAPSELTVRQQYKEIYGNRSLKRKEKAEAIEKLTADSIAAAKKDSAFWADYVMLSYELKNDSGSFALAIPDEHKAEVKSYFGARTDYRTLVTILFILLPLIVFTIKTIVRFSRVSRTRKRIDAEYAADMATYKEDLHIFQTRPQLLDYVDYCREFLSHDTTFTTLGDPVGQTLRSCGVFNETDVPGKILFLNYYAQYNKEDRSRSFTGDPFHVFDRVYFVVAVPQADRMIINYNYWDTLENELEHSDMETIYYRNINSVSIRDGSIVIEMNGTTKDIFLGPYKMNLLDYQHTDPMNRLTYSACRTGNPQEFVAALNQLIASCH